MSAGPQAGPRKNRGRRFLPIRTGGILAAAAIVGASLAISTVSLAASSGKATARAAAVTAPAREYRVLAPAETPIKHVVVLFNENVTFDHYFGTYPTAANTDGSPFHAATGTPAVNGLTPALLTANPNSFNPQRLTSSEALTCDQNHGYAAEQKAFDGGKMDLFVQNTQTATCSGQPVLFGAPGLVMDYYDGNTVTGLWNYAQNYAMSDNDWDTTFGPSTPGALNVISGDTGGAKALTPVWSATPSQPATSTAVNDGSMNGYADPYYETSS